MTDVRRRIPAVDRLLTSEAFAPLLAGSPRALVVRATQRVQEELRSAIAEGRAPSAEIDDPAWYAERVANALAALERPSLRRVINATGVVLHTNLGRAPLGEAARAAVERVTASYANLEYDLEAGRRGSRYDHCAELLAELTGAEAALVVNNNAAAVVLALNTLADGMDAVISRGELVEIGGSFRVPEIMAKSGARMVEVGATNRTHADDYAAAISDRTGVVLAVHRSNFRVSGFTADVPLPELVALAHGRGVAVVNDLGSGLLVDPSTLGLPATEPTAADALRAGADVVTMSGDKVLGGPQAGIILGRAEAVARMRRNPLCRALRVDKMTLAALEGTLALYREPGRARRELPALRMLAFTADELAARAASFAETLRDAGVTVRTEAGDSAVGGGAFPGAALPTTLVLLEVERVAPEAVLERLRGCDPPVVARIVNDRAAIDLRTVFEAEEEALAAAVVAACGRDE